MRSASLWKALGRHACLWLVVVFLPVVIYSLVDNSGRRHIRGLDMYGGITYPFYVTFCITKLKSFRAKFILIHLTLVLTVAVGVSFSLTNRTPLTWLALPIAVGALPILSMVASWVRHIPGLALTSLFSLLLALPASMALSFVLVYASAMASLGHMRY